MRITAHLGHCAAMHSAFFCVVCSQAVVEDLLALRENIVVRCSFRSRTPRDKELNPAARVGLTGKPHVENSLNPKPANSPREILSI